VEPMPYHERNILLREFDAAAEAALLASAGPGAECADWAVELRHLGGAAGRTPAVPSAVGSRAAAFTLTTLTSPDADSGVRTALAPWSTGGRYVNFLAGPGTERLTAEAYDAETYARLRAVKRRYDPENAFRHGHAVPPAATGAERTAPAGNPAPGVPAPPAAAEPGGPVPAGPADGGRDAQAGPAGPAGSPVAGAAPPAAAEAAGPPSPDGPAGPDSPVRREPAGAAPPGAGGPPPPGAAEDGGAAPPGASGPGAGTAAGPAAPAGAAARLHRRVS